MSPSQFLVDTENLQLDARDIARLNQILTSTAPGYPQDTENLQLDAQDLARLNSALTSMLGVDSENLKLSPHDVAVLKPHLIHPYVAKAVHFDGATQLVNAALTASGDSTGLALFSIWFKPKNPSAPNGAFPQLWRIDPQNTYTSGQNVQGGATDPNSGDPSNVYSPGFFDVTSSLSLSLCQHTPLNFTDFGIWWNEICAVKTNFGAGLKTYQYYHNDVHVVEPDSAGSGDTSAAFTMVYNGLPFWFGADSFAGDNFEGDVADFRFFPGVYLDLSVTANRRLFVSASNKPVDPAVATAALGTPGAVLFSGNKDSFGTNQGTGGAFTLTGTLTNATSPSD